MCSSMGLLLCKPVNKYGNTWWAKCLFCDGPGGLFVSRNHSICTMENLHLKISQGCIIINTYMLSTAVFVGCSWLGNQYPWENLGAAYSCTLLFWGFVKWLNLVVANPCDVSHIYATNRKCTQHMPGSRFHLNSCWMDAKDVFKVLQMALQTHYHIFWTSLVDLFWHCCFFFFLSSSCNKVTICVNTSYYNNWPKTDFGTNTHAHTLLFCVYQSSGEVLKWWLSKRCSSQTYTHADFISVWAALSRTRLQKPFLHMNSWQCQRNEVGEIVFNCPHT